MKKPSALKVVFSRLLEDREFVATFIIGVVILLAEVASPPEWKLALRSVALVMLLGGFGFYLYGHIRSARLLFADKPIPLVFAVNVPRQEGIRAMAMLHECIRVLTGFDAFSKVERYFNVHYEDMLAHRADPLPSDPKAWEDFLDDSQHEVRQFLQHVPGGRVYHVAVRGPSTLALGLGAVLGTRNPVVGYHYDGAAYQPVLNLSTDTRRIKTSLPSGEPSQFIRVQYPEVLSEDTAVVLDMAGHVATGDVRAYLARQEPSKSFCLVVVSNTYGGNLTDEDWTPVVQELFQVFNVLQRDANVRRIHLFHSMPIPLALGLGMALGTFVPVTVYNWEKAEGTYFPVLRLNELRSLL